MKNTQFFLTVIITIFLYNFSFSQTLVKGKITDAANGEELAGASVSLTNSLGTISEYDGSYELSLEDGEHELTFSYLGYADLVKVITVNGEEEIVLDITLSIESEILGLTTITGSNIEKSYTKEAVSIEVIRPEAIAKNANTDLAQVIERVPGVQVVDGQANIRSGSGFAYGAGSRVAVVVDGQPLLSAELSDVKWNFIPIENAAQIEILKGSASVLYGSGGLNGVINVRTAFPTSEAYTKITTYAGLYNISNKNGRRWYAKDVDTLNVGQPFFTGVYFAHRQKIKDNFDLVLGSNVHYNKNYMKQANEQRYRFNFNTRYRLPKNDRVTIGLNGNIMYHEIADFFIWEDGYENAYVHIETPDEARYTTYTLDPYLNAFDKNENQHKLKFRYFNILKTSSSSPTGLFSGDYQFQKNFDEIDLNVAAGISYQHFYAKSNLFIRETVITEENDTIVQYSTENADITALYTQIEKGFFNGRLNTTLGMRLESFKVSQDSLKVFPVFRGGVNYALSKKDFLRASFGQGYRIPSLAERYINEDITTGINVFPNYDLKIETGSSTEIGYKRAFGKEEGEWKGFVDFALFWMDYDNLIDFQFGMYVPDTLLPTNPTLADSLGLIVLNPDDFLGFKATNVSRARIAGFEVSGFGEGKLWGLPVRFTAGYTYSYPGDLTENPNQENVGVFIKNLFNGFIMKPDDPLVNSLLNFRSMHIGRLDVEMDVKNFTFGMAANYNGFMYDIDDFFKGEGVITEFVLLFDERVNKIVTSLADFRKGQINGDWVLDFRASYSFNEKNKIDFMLNNALNREYSIRPLKMSPPMTINLRYNRTF